MGMPGIRAIFVYFLSGIAIALMMYVILLIRPSLDLEVSHLFFNDTKRFGLYRTDFSALLRKAIIWLILIFYVLVTWHGVQAYSKQLPSFGWPWHKWGFLGACALAGPVLIVNILLKGNWGRSRPRHLEIFGETQDFTQFWVYADECRDNCSFASGEASGVAMIFISLSFLFERRLRLLILSMGVTATIISAWLRVSVGAHFMSDTVVGPAIMLIVASFIYCAFYIGEGSWIKTLNNVQAGKIASKRAVK